MAILLKRIGIILAGLLLSLTVAVLVLYTIGKSRLHNAQVPTRPVAAAGSPDALERGEFLVKSVSACVDCHGENLEGKPFVDEAPVGYIAAPNLTSGSGGVAGGYTEEDWERAIRHGVGGDGRVLGGMPSDNYASLSDDDLAAIIAYLQSLPPIDNELPGRSISFIGTILFGIFGYQDLPVARIDHAAVGSLHPIEDVSIEYGKYLVDVAGCRDCHGADLVGRSPEQAASGPPAGPNLTPAGSLGGWGDVDFLHAMRTGETPDGRYLSDSMPWPAYSGMRDGELQAIWLYLHSLQPSP